MSQITFSEARGPKNDLNDRLAGEDGSIWLEALKRFLRKENPWAMVGTFLVSVTLGVIKTIGDLRKTLKESGCNVSTWANDLLSKIALPKRSVTLDLVVVSVEELGFPRGATREAIYARTKELGLALCPAWVGPALRLAYKNQPKGEWLLIGMEPITDSDLNPVVFYVEHGGAGLWLNTHCDGAGDAAHVWNPERRWVFVRAKPAKAGE